MGVINVTPDSFYDGGKHQSLEAAFLCARKMIADGVDIIDIGGESTRPVTAFHIANGLRKEVTEDEERQRVIPLIQKLRHEFPTQKLSVDTRRSVIAKEALSLGVNYISCVCESVSEDMAKVLSQFPHAFLIVCHMRGQPKNMQEGDFHQGPMIPYLKEWFQTQIEFLKSFGVGNIILDPGIGFGKRKPDQDFEILRGISDLKTMNYPLLIGLSRKSFMGKVLDKSADNLLSATLAMNTYALMQGADIIRVHDVPEHKDVLTILNNFASL